MSQTRQSGRRLGETLLGISAPGSPRILSSTPANLTLVQTLPSRFFNSKFWVEGGRAYTNRDDIGEYRSLRAEGRSGRRRQRPGGGGITRRFSGGPRRGPSAATGC